MRKNNIIRWKLISNRNGFKRCVEGTKQIIRNAVTCARFCVCWSGGKDSTAMCHLVKEMYPDIPIVVQFDDCDWPEKKAYIRTVAEMFGWVIHSAQPLFSVWDKVKDIELKGERITDQTHWITREGFISPLEKKRKEIGCNGAFIGLRIEESRARFLNHAVRGEVYKVANGEWRALPMSYWKTSYVFAYHVANDIPINPCYFNNGYYQPEEIRLSWALPQSSENYYAHLQHIRTYYPKQYAKLREVGKT